MCTLLNSSKSLITGQVRRLSRCWCNEVTGLNVKTQHFPACLLGFLALASATRILFCVMENIPHPGQIPAAGDTSCFQERFVGKKICPTTPQVCFKLKHPAAEQSLVVRTQKLLIKVQSCGRRQLKRDCVSELQTEFIHNKYLQTRPFAVKSRRKVGNNVRLQTYVSVSLVLCVCLCVGLRVSVRDPTLDHSFTMERTITFQMFLRLSCTQFGLGIKLKVDADQLSDPDMTGQTSLLKTEECGLECFEVCGNVQYFKREGGWVRE